MRHKLFLACCSLFLLATMPAWGQTSNKSKSMNDLLKVSHANKKAKEKVTKKNSTNSSTLSLSLLSQATSIEYSTDMGSVPEWHDCKIIVKKESVKVRMTKGYGNDNKVVLDQTLTLAASQYQQLINSLANQTIKKVKSSEVLGVGGGSSSIKVQKGSSTLFSGDENVDLEVGRGELIDSFLKILPYDVVKKILNFLDREYKMPS